MAGQTDSEETQRLSRDARNQEIFNSRLDRVKDVICPWLMSVAPETVASAAADLDTSSATSCEEPEDKEHRLVRAVGSILALALPEEDTKVPDTLSSSLDPATTEAPAYESPVGDMIYDQLRLNEDKATGPCQQILLVKLFPSSGTDPNGGEVVASMFCVTSPHEQEYEALSYTWGPRSPQRTITLNGHTFNVGPNLFNALVSLRLPDRPRLLWVDALCINQNDENEKTEQVAVMGSIYREAQRVLIFLGLPTSAERSYALFDLVEREKRVDHVTQENLEEIMEECQVDKTAVVTSFIEFCDREWWSRVWVMQEYYLATRPPLWYVGSRCLDGGKLCRDIRVLAMTALRLALPFGHSGGDLPFGNHTSSTLMDRIFKVIDGVLIRQVTHPYNTPRLLFAKQEARRATNVKDYVYGVRELLEPNFRRVFVPDYGLSEAKLFATLAAWLLVVDGWGDMFWYYPFRGAGTQQVPSWVPDFSQRPEHLSNEPEAPKFSSDNPKTVHCAIVDRVLYIDGCHLDIVGEVIYMPREGSTCFEVLQKVWQVDRVLCSNQRSGHSTEPATLYLDNDRASRALLDWVTTIRPATLPLASESRNMTPLIGPDLTEYVDGLAAEVKRLHDEGHARAKASPNSPNIRQWYVEYAAELTRTHGKRVRGVTNLHEFLSTQMECDFPSACIFDFENLDSQLRSMGEYAHDISSGLDLLLSRYGPHEVVYGDLIQSIWTNSYPGNPDSFRDLVELVRGIAKKIHDTFTGAPGSQEEHPTLDPSTMGISEVEAAISSLKKILNKLEEGDEMAWRSVGKDEASRDEKETFMQGLRERIKTTECLVAWRTRNEARYNQINGANDSSWKRIDEEKAAQFRGRHFFVTKAGLIGIACPGVGEVKVGDQVILLDGMSFPVIARVLDEDDSKLAVVGCANVRGVKPQDRVEDVELRADVIPGPRQMFAFV